MKFYKSTVQVYGSSAGRLVLLISLLSAGQFISCSAFLPSAFCACTTMLAYAGWMSGDNALAVGGIAAGAIIGWPFGAALGIPIAYDILIRKSEAINFIYYSSIFATMFAVPMIVIDSYYYGQFVFAPWNIIKYNIFSDHGPNLYGTEPLQFYFLNGALNFNMVFLLAIFSMPFIYCVHILLRLPSKRIPIWLLLAPMYIWAGIFFNQSHKEERFLFPIYPLICLSSGLFIDYAQRAFASVSGFLNTGTSSSFPSGFKRPHAAESTAANTTVSLAAVMYLLINLSRVLALYMGYHTPLDLYGQLSTLAGNSSLHTFKGYNRIHVCVTKEWHRYPSSFFMPQGWDLKFVKSEFNGLLPGVYNMSRSYPGNPEVTRYRPRGMNDMNRESPLTMVPLERCHYLVDILANRFGAKEPNYHSMPDRFKPVIDGKFLNVERSKKLYRAFYIPYLSNKYTEYTEYTMFKNLKINNDSKKIRKTKKIIF